MVSKLVLVFAAILCICQGATMVDKTKQNVIEVDPQSILDDAIKLYNELKELVQKAIDSALGTLGDILNDISHSADSIITGAISTINEEFGKLLDQLNGLKDEAIELGIDITECTAEKEDEFLALPGKVIDELKNCVTNKVEEAKQIVNGTIDDITGTWQDVLDLGDELTNCGSGLGAILCITKVIGKITLETVELPAKIADDVLKVKMYVATLVPALEACAAVNIAAVTVDGGKLVLEIGECIQDKINNATSII